jgi:hypothetical protein
MMKIGLLWYDDDPKCGLSDKVSRAAKRYVQKFGTPPNVCYVHPSAIDACGATREVDGVHVDTLMSVLRNHFWLGQEDLGPARRRPASA